MEKQVPELIPWIEGEPLGQRTSAVRWLQKQVQNKSRRLPRQFDDLESWLAFRRHLRETLPKQIGIPTFPPIQAGAVRARLQVSGDILCERVDVYVDEDYGIPALVFKPSQHSAPLPALVWNPGYGENKWVRTYQSFAVRMARQGFLVLILDHAPFGETTPYQMDDKASFGMTVIMSLGDMLGYSQLGLRAAETRRAGEYLRRRSDVDPARVAVAGLCQGGMDTWLSAALDETFCAAACFCSASTFTINGVELSSYHALSDSSPYPFGILDVCDVDHLHAAIAPRPLLVRANIPDHWWSVSGFSMIESLTRKIYRLFEAEDRLDMSSEVHEHNLTGPFADSLENFLLKYLSNH